MNTLRNANMEWFRMCNQTINIKYLCAEIADKKPVIEDKHNELLKVETIHIWRESDHKNDKNEEEKQRVYIDKIRDIWIQ